MTADDGSCPNVNLRLGGVCFGDSRESGAACSPICEKRAGGAPARNGLSLVQEPADLRELFLELRAPICRYLMSLGLQRAEAEDIAQESFLKLCQRGAKETGSAGCGGATDDPTLASRTWGTQTWGAQVNVRGWIFRVAQNMALDEHRRRKRRPMEELADENLPPFAPLRVGHPQSPEENLLEREQDARLKAALQRLPEQQRLCLHLRAEGLRYREMAEVLGVATSTVAEWIQKALKQLERELA